MVNSAILLASTGTTPTSARWCGAGLIGHATASLRVALVLEYLVSEMRQPAIETDTASSPAAEHRREAQQALRLGVLTVSDSRTEANDTSGQLLVDRFSQAGHSIVHRQIVRDEIEDIREVVRQAQAMHLDALLITGGTGVSARDCTPEAIEPV